LLQAVSEWLRHLIFLILLAVMVELILPQNGLQKYARSVFGLLIVVSMLGPLASLFDGNLSAQIMSQGIGGPLLGPPAGGAQTSGTYQADLEQAIHEDITATLGVGVDNVRVITSLQPDGSQQVDGVSVLTGPSVTAGEREEIRTEICDTLGLAANAVEVSGI